MDEGGTRGEDGEAASKLDELERQRERARMFVGLAFTSMSLALAVMEDECRKATRWLWGLRALAFVNIACCMYDLANLDGSLSWYALGALATAASSLYVLRHERQLALIRADMLSRTAMTRLEIETLKGITKNESGA
jgi:hypothetical protein